MGIAQYYLRRRFRMVRIMNCRDSVEARNYGGNVRLNILFGSITRKIMGQDVSFVSDNRKGKRDHDERSHFRETTQRMQVQAILSSCCISLTSACCTAAWIQAHISVLEAETQILREAIAKHNIEGIPSREEIRQNLKVQPWLLTLPDHNIIVFIECRHFLTGT